ncbi:hypothetical protein [Ruminiclostridium josui]|uniref:hypothetical protein n=1 Tax=Ruminiclostridium josui TaxID=1499 RepID=UPI00046601B5|nr:hypothetical protein [Ruminiclostridium josui]
MKKCDLKDLNFFLLSDGEEDTVSLQLNCLESSIYNILKNSINIDKNVIASLFIRDINPSLWLHNTDNTLRINNESKNLTPLWSKYIKLNEYVKIQEKDSIDLLKWLLDEGHMVIVQTVFEKMKFYHKYDPNFDLNTYYQGPQNHVNILLHYEDDKIYFAEKAPYSVNKDNYVTYDLNSQIGVAPISELAEACSHFLRCYTLKINETELHKYNTMKHELKDFINAMAENYFKGSYEDLYGYTIYYGIDALNKFIQLSHEGYNLKNYFKTVGWEQRDRLTFDFWMIHGARILLLECLKQEKDDNSGEYKELLATLQESITRWTILGKHMNKILQSKVNNLNSKTAALIKDLIELESNMHIMLTKYFSTAAT